jgi:tetratricopeptide (TPR) repeat protein
LEAASNSDEMLSTAREYFRENKYALAEPLLNQLILKNAKSPEVFQMLGTIYYDQGKFNKAIRGFKRALELEPTYTDASVGLSIILNDIGKYEEGRKVFDEARELLSKQTANEDPYVNEKFGIKHEDYPGFLSARVRLGKMLYDSGDVQGAIEQWEATTHRDPNHAEAQRLLRQAQAITTQRPLDL